MSFAVTPKELAPVKPKPGTDLPPRPHLGSTIIRRVPRLRVVASRPRTLAPA